MSFPRQIQEIVRSMPIVPESENFPVRGIALLNQDPGVLTVRQTEVLRSTEKFSHENQCVGFAKNNRVGVRDAISGNSVVLAANFAVA